jgi:hypothetical protein
MLGDLLMVAYGIAPVLGAGVVSMLRKREWRSGIAAVTASAAAIVASELVSWLARAMGAFKSVDGVSVATSAQMLVNLRATEQVSPASPTASTPGGSRPSCRTFTS